VPKNLVENALVMGRKGRIHGPVTIQNAESHQEPEANCHPQHPTMVRNQAQSAHSVQPRKSRSYSQGRGAENQKQAKNIALANWLTGLSSTELATAAVACSSGQAMSPRLKDMVYELL
ncbi:MAG: hypothetical protein AAF722_09255, partial [Cyanobacteria bacterium P01_C01_bin.70]